MAEQAKLQISVSSIIGSVVEIDRNNLPANFPVDVFRNVGGSLRYFDLILNLQHATSFELCSFDHTLQPSASWQDDQVDRMKQRMALRTFRFLPLDPADRVQPVKKMTVRKYRCCESDIT